MLSVVSEVATVALTASSVLGMGLRIMQRIENVLRTLERHGDQIDKFEARIADLEKVLRDFGNGKSS